MILLYLYCKLAREDMIKLVSSMKMVEGAWWRA